MRDQLVLPDNGFVRADGEIVEGLSGVRGPLPKRLRKQRQRRHKDKGAGALKTLRRPKRNPGLPGAAGHDCLTALGPVEALDDFADRLSDVRKWLLRLRRARAKAVERF